APDYRVPPLPVSRWSFNGLQATNPTTVRDVQGNNTLSISYSNDNNTGSTLVTGGSLRASFADTTCTTSAPVSLEDKSYSLSAVLRFAPFNGQTVNLFRTRDTTKPGFFQSGLSLDATTSDWGQHV